MSEGFDIAIVGAGMAGASLAAALLAAAPRLKIALIEGEAQPGYHATGRSAAFWTESYGGPGVLPLTLASGPLLCDLGVLTPRGALTLGRAGEGAALDSFAARYGALGVRVERLGRAELARRIPGLREGWQEGVFEPDCADIGVAGLHQHYLRVAKRGGAEVLCGAGLTAAKRVGDGWRLTLRDGRVLTAIVLANAAGAWADDVAALAGVRRLGIQPYRRTMVQLRCAAPVPADLPLVLDLAGSFYFKPEGTSLWLSPHDETPSPPCDAAPEEIDVAHAIARFERVTDWRALRVEHRWAGLRSFAPDRLPVYGFERHEPGFFWFAGQGGFGIQTAPAAAELGAWLLLGEAGPVPFGGALDAAAYAPGRFG